MQKNIFKTVLAYIAAHIQDFKAYYHGLDYMLALQDYDNALRNKVKYTDERGSYEGAREMLWQVLEDRNLDIWDLI